MSLTRGRMGVRDHQRLPEYSRGIEYCDCRVPAGSGGPSPPDIGAFTRASPHIVHRGLKFNR